jgi:hypothetical protein
MKKEVAAKKEAPERTAEKIVTKAKTADELNRILARHLDILNGQNVSVWDIRLAEAVSNLIGKQTKIESVKIAYGELALKTGKSYEFQGEAK